MWTLFWEEEFCIMQSFVLPRSHIHTAKTTGLLQAYRLGVSQFYLRLHNRGDSESTACNCCSCSWCCLCIINEPADQRENPWSLWKFQTRISSLLSKGGLPSPCINTTPEIWNTPPGKQNKNYLPCCKWTVAEVSYSACLLDGSQTSAGGCGLVYYMM